MAWQPHRPAGPAGPSLLGRDPRGPFDFFAPVSGGLEFGMPWSSPPWGHRGHPRLLQRPWGAQQARCGRVTLHGACRASLPPVARASSPGEGRLPARRRRTAGSSTGFWASAPHSGCPDAIHKRLLPSYLKLEALCLTWGIAGLVAKCVTGRDGLGGHRPGEGCPCGCPWLSCEQVLCGHERRQWTRTLGDPGGGAVVGFLLTVMGGLAGGLVVPRGLLLSPDLPDPASELGSGMRGPLVSE